MSTEAETEVPQAPAFRSQPLPGVLDQLAGSWRKSLQESLVRDSGNTSGNMERCPVAPIRQDSGTGVRGGAARQPGPSSHLALLGGRELGGSWAPGQSPWCWPKIEVGGLTPEGHLGPLPATPTNTDLAPGPKGTFSPPA